LRKPIGYIDFDPNITPELSYTSYINVAEENVEKIYRGKYVEIVSMNNRRFMGRVIGGPFYMPEGISSKSFIAKTFTIRGERFSRPPPYYASFLVEIIGEIKDESLKTVYTKPPPRSTVYEMSTIMIEKLLKIGIGDMDIGYLLDYKGVKIRLSSRDKNVLPRNIGIFGTIGSGKTNTAQVIIEEASKNGWAVFVLDVEGEYTYMDQPNDNDKMNRALRSIYGFEPEGLKNFAVYVPIGRRSSRKNAVEFGIPFSEINPYVFSEIIEATEAQQRYLGIILDELKEAKRVEERSGGEFEEVVFGKDKTEAKITIYDVVSYISQSLSSLSDRFMKSSYIALSTKLDRLIRLGFIDNGDPIPIMDRMEPGYVSIIDLSDTEDTVRNIAIAWILDKIFRIKLRELKNVKTMIVIEEAHSFISREKREKMTATIDMLKMIARRGRKRWLSLVFISQQPGHLPPEIFELCNTRIIHALRSEPNIKAIRETTGGLKKEHIDMISKLSVGEALITSPQILTPMIMKIRPAKTKKLY